MYGNALFLLLNGWCASKPDAGDFAFGGEVEFNGIGPRELRGSVLEKVKLERDIPPKDIGRGANLIIEKQMLICLIYFDAFRQGKWIFEMRHIVGKVFSGERLFPEGARKRNTAALAF